MEKASTVVEILYYEECNDLVVDCPQLGIAGVSEVLLVHNELSPELVISYFEERLKKQVNRFENESAFIETMFLHGYWDVKSENLVPKPMKYYVETYPYLKRKLAIPSIKSLNYEFEYSLEIPNKILQISESLDEILNDK